MPATTRVIKFECRLVADPHGRVAGSARWMSKYTYLVAQSTGTLADPLLGHPLDCAQTVLLAGEVVFSVRSTEGGRPVVRFFSKSIYSPTDIVLAGEEINRA